jgi:hypothetical protein
MLVFGQCKQQICALGILAAHACEALCVHVLAQGMEFSVLLNAFLVELI